MKLFACLLIFLIAVPFCAFIAVMGLQDEGPTYTDLELSSVAQPGGGPKFRVAIDGYLLRTVAPDAARMKGKYVLPFVSQTEAEAAVAEGSFRYGPQAIPVFVEVPGEELPVEAFLRREGDRPDPVAVPFSFQGTKRTTTKKKLPVIARVPGAGDGREVVHLTVETERKVTRGMGIAYAIAGLLFLLLGRKVFRSWRRDRREFKAAVERIEAERAGRIPPRAAGGARPSPAVGGGFGFPWGKVAGVFVVIAVIGAKVGKHAGSSVDDIARTVMRSADEAARLGKQSDNLTAGERALEAAGAALDVESIVEVAVDAASPEGDVDTGPGTPAPRKIQKESVTVSLELTVTDSDETYYVDHWLDVGVEVGGEEGAAALDFTPPNGEPLRFSLHASRTEASIEGRITGFPRISRAATSSERPDGSRGELTRIELTQAGDGVRLTHEFAEAMDLGYVQIFRGTADLEYLNGGSWAELCSGDRPISLGFTEAGRQEYARMIAPAFARAAEFSLQKEGVAGLSLTAEYSMPPEEFIDVHRGRLLLSQRGLSRMLLRGGN